MNLQTLILTGPIRQSLWECANGHMELLRLPLFLTQVFRPLPLLHLLASKRPIIPFRLHRAPTLIVAQLDNSPSHMSKSLRTCISLQPISRSSALRRRQIS